MTTINLTKIEQKVNTQLQSIIKENPKTLEKYIVGSILDGWEQATQQQPYDINVTIPEDITLQQGSLGDANRNLYLNELTINGENFSLHLHNHDIDKNQPHHKL